MKQTIILLYGGRSAEREVYVLSAESVMRAVNYDRFTVKTFFINNQGDFIKTQEFSQTPGVKRIVSRPMRPLTGTRKSRKVPSMKEGAVVFPVLHGPDGRRWLCSGFLEVLKMPMSVANILSSESCHG